MSILSESAPVNRVGTVVESLAREFEGCELESPRLTAELLVSHLLNRPRLQLQADRNTEIDEEGLQKLHEYASRIRNNEPLQYVLGETDFMGHILYTDPRALIPRPETEQLVEEVLKCKPLWGRQHPHIADVGTGSGCIALALILRRPAADYSCVDFNDETLSLAQANARGYDVEQEIRWHRADLLECFPPASLDAIVANLPYVESDACGRLPKNVRCFEPISALDGGPDGLSLISRLVEEAPKKLKSQGWLFLEIGEEQGDRVSQLFRRAEFVNVAVVRDLAGRDRIMLGTKP